MSSVRFSGLNLQAYLSDRAANTFRQKERDIPHYFVAELDTNLPDEEIRAIHEQAMAIAPSEVRREAVEAE
mgnify:CR=1 FL=1